MSIGIFINSSNRCDNVKTTLQFPKSWEKITYILVPKEQYQNYKKVCQFGKVVPIPDCVPHYLPSQRQWAIQHGSAGMENLFFMDDDLSFMARDSNFKLKKSDDSGMEDMLSSVKRHLEDGVPLVGVSPRLGNNRVTDDYLENNRVSRCFALNRNIFLKNNLTFAPFEPFVMEDFFVTLALLKLGYPNRIIFTHAQSDGGSNTPGGCSIYRDSDSMLKSVRFLQKTYGTDVVRLKIKSTKNSWSGDSSTFQKNGKGETVRPDVVISWKKAYKPRTVTKTGINKFF